MRRFVILLSTAALVLAGGGLVAGAPAAHHTPGKKALSKLGIHHVFVIVLENESSESTYLHNPHPYLGKTLQHVDRPALECARPDEFQSLEPGHQGAFRRDSADRLHRSLGQERTDRQQSSALVWERPDPIGAYADGDQLSSSEWRRRREANAGERCREIGDLGRTAIVERPQCEPGQLGDERAGRGGIDRSRVVFVEQERIDLRVGVALERRAREAGLEF